MNAPGTRLRAMAARVFSAAAMARLIDPAVADLQAEYDEASRDGRNWRTRWIWIRGHVAIVKMIVVHAVRQLSLQGVSLDLRLAVRLLVKHKGLTAVGVAAMAFAIWSGLVGFELYAQLVSPTMPLDGGDRIVGIVMNNAASAGEDMPALHDFVPWRGALNSIQNLSAFRRREVNVIVGNGPAEPVEAAEITAGAFDVARTRPLFGRTLRAGDEQLSAPPVVVIGHDVWRTKFDSDPAVIGRELRLGNVTHTIVGVMPDGFRFPFAQSYWVPLRLDPVRYDRRQSPPLNVFGTLAPGATLATAQAELDVLGAAAAVQFPDTHKHLMPRVLPYIQSVFGSSFSHMPEIYTLSMIVVLLLVLICSNVALLMFARAATRESELIVRAALGASRGRIVAQLFIEALVLAIIAGGVGVTAAKLIWGRIFDVVILVMFETRSVPFWLHRSLSPGTVTCALLLTLVAAAIAGLLPGMKVTRRIGARLRQSAPGGGGLRFGGMWTVLIVLQVGVMAAVPFFLYALRGERARAMDAIDAGSPAAQYLSATIAMDWNESRGATRDQFAARLGASLRELERQIEAEPGILGVTLADRLPLMHPSVAFIELEGEGAAAAGVSRRHRVSSEWIALDFFDVMDAPVLAGRRFHSGDLLRGARTVIVNQSFARLVAGGNSPIGRRVRYRDRGLSNEPWYEIVGVIEDLGIAPQEPDPKRSRIHHPLNYGQSHPVQMAIHTSADPQLFASRVREIATAVDPQLRLTALISLDQARASDFRLFALLFWTIGTLTAIVMLVSLSGIYSVFAFAASRRTREIGIRMALGADRRQIAAALFRRPMAQVALGILMGLGIVALGVSEDVPRSQLAWVGVYGVGVAAVCALATVGPVRRALRIQPTEALRAD